MVYYQDNGEKKLVQLQNKKQLNQLIKNLFERLVVQAFIHLPFRMDLAP